MEDAVFLMLVVAAAFFAGVVVGHWVLPPRQLSSYQDSKRRDKQRLRERNERKGDMK